VGEVNNMAQEQDEISAGLDAMVRKFKF